MSHNPRKRFGQHFLRDHQVLAQIVEAIAPRADEALLEIGPGEGALTAAILSRIDQLSAIEIDRDLIPLLQKRFGNHLRLFAGDALRFDFSAIAPIQGLRIIGNLPYNISTPLIFHLMKVLPHICDMTFLLQREVVERLAAKPGTKAYGRLSVMVQYGCDAKALFTVSPSAFTPPPKVDSALIRLTPWRSVPYPANNERLFAQLVKQAFSQRRKTLKRVLKGEIDSTGFIQADIDPMRRAETLSVAEFVKLANEIRTRRG
ncbi:16S rRNA (adenine(1518)-N(6)/adenine(1519)-N(6))-dimethyltransferase RsmA [Acidihalobacter prosperus]